LQANSGDVVGERHKFFQFLCGFLQLAFATVFLPEYVVQRGAVGASFGLKASVADRSVVLASREVGGSSLSSRRK